MNSAKNQDRKLRKRRSKLEALMFGTLLFVVGLAGYLPSGTLSSSSPWSPMLPRAFSPTHSSQHRLRCCQCQGQHPRDAHAEPPHLPDLRHAIAREHQGKYTGVVNHARTGPPFSGFFRLAPARSKCRRCLLFRSWMDEKAGRSLRSKLVESSGSPGLGWSNGTTPNECIL